MQIGELGCPGWQSLRMIAQRCNAMCCEVRHSIMSKIKVGISSVIVTVLVCGERSYGYVGILQCVCVFVCLKNHKLQTFFLINSVKLQANMQMLGIIYRGAKYLHCIFTHAHVCPRAHIRTHIWRVRKIGSIHCHIHSVSVIVLLYNNGNQQRDPYLSEWKSLEDK